MQRRPLLGVGAAGSHRGPNAKRGDTPALKRPTSDLLAVRHFHASSGLYHRCRGKVKNVGKAIHKHMPSTPERTVRSHGADAIAPDVVSDSECRAWCKQFGS